MPYSIDLIRQLARLHGVGGEPVLLPQGGMVNDAYRIGDAVLRIVQESMDSVADGEAALEQAIVPLAMNAGVLTPELIACDSSCTHAPRPYTIYRLAPGVVLGKVDRDPKEFKSLYRVLGREIYKISQIEVPGELRPLLNAANELDLRPKITKTVDSGAISAEVGKEMEAWLDDVESKVGPAEPEVLLHADLHPWNLMVEVETGDLNAILDWGDASWGDLSQEFASMPHAAMREMISGFTDAGGEWNPGLTLRTQLHGLQLALWEVRELDASVFARRWWRMPIDDWRKLVDY